MYLGLLARCPGVTWAFLQGCGAAWSETCSQQGDGKLLLHWVPCLVSHGSRSVRDLPAPGAWWRCCRKADTCLGTSLPPDAEATPAQQENPSEGTSGWPGTSPGVITQSSPTGPLWGKVCRGCPCPRAGDSHEAASPRWICPGPFLQTPSIGRVLWCPLWMVAPSSSPTCCPRCPHHSLELQVLPWFLPGAWVGAWSCSCPRFGVTPWGHPPASAASPSALSPLF